MNSTAKPPFTVPQFAEPQFYPPKTSLVCKSVEIVPRYTVLLHLPNLIYFPQEAQ